MLHALTIFLGAFLLFLVQPLIGKFILPWFGGSPGVWTTCLLFFQSLLLAGYAYAHFTSTRLRPRAQAVVHLVLLALALAWLPIAPDAEWKPGAGDEPTLRILLLLTATLGLPYVLLSATGPLVQRWFHLTRPGESPYRLYALSNAGSLLALLAFPFVLEPLVARTTQAWAWSGGLVLFAVLCGASAWRIARLNPPPPEESAPAPTPATAEAADTPTTAAPASAPAAAAALVTPATAEIAAEPAPAPAVESPAAAPDDAKPDWSRRFFWLALPAVASVLLVATTSKLSTDVAVIPFLWVLPLALYLLSFIVSFDHPRWYRREVFAGLFAAACVLVGYLLSTGSHAAILGQVAGYGAALFVACMICHGEAYRLRPAPRHLTSFYLHLSAGGALGGLFVAVAAPVLFSDYHELHLGYWLLAYLFASLALLQRDRSVTAGVAVGAAVAALVLPALHLGPLTGDGGLARLKLYATSARTFYTEYWMWTAAAAVLAAGSLPGLRRAGRGWTPRFALFPLGLTALLGAVFFFQATAGRDNLVESSRNFYGTLKVRSYGDPGTISHNLVLSHGVTTHGLQFTRPPYETWTTTYYGSESGIGLALDLAEPTTGGRHFGLVGLGVGTLAAYGMPGDKLRIYEINPTVLTLARERFSFLRSTAADLKIVMGDARLSMEDELRHDSPQGFDVLALDAFSSDAIPVHLLTVEAFELYLRHMKPDGVIAVHISNRYLDLRPVVEALAKHFGLHYATVSHDPKEDEWWLYRTTWVLLSRDAARIDAPAIRDVADFPSDDTAELVLWTDDHASLLPTLK